MNEQEGLTIIYTGDGKGKTTAAMGLALRAAGYNKKVCVIQFVKIWFTGELKGFESLPNVEFIQAGKGFYKIMNDRQAPEEHKKAAEAALELAKEKILSDKYDVVILDEIIGTMVGELLPSEPVLELIQQKPARLDIVLTGRHAETIPGLLEMADMVTEMKKVKHPYDEGILAKEGIDF
jgi:cob(I)alamin adenosyltransferase